MLDPEDYETDNVRGDNSSYDADVKAEFTGRELLLSSIEEKCFHQVIKEIIAEDKHD